MSNSESKAHGAETPSPAAEVKTALSGFLGQFKDFQADVSAKLQEQEERLTMLDRKTMTTSRARPALAGAAADEAPHQKAFGAYLRTGDDDALRGLAVQGARQRDETTHHRHQRKQQTGGSTVEVVLVLDVDPLLDDLVDGDGAGREPSSRERVAPRRHRNH